MNISMQGFEAWPGHQAGSSNEQTALRASWQPQGPELPQVELEQPVEAPVSGQDRPLTGSERTAQALAIARQILHLPELPALENPADWLERPSQGTPAELSIGTKTYALAATLRHLENSYPEGRLCLAAVGAAEHHGYSEIAEKIHAIVAQLNADHGCSLTPADLLALIQVGFGAEQDPLLLYSWPATYPNDQLDLELRQSGFTATQIAPIVSQSGPDGSCRLSHAQCRQLIEADREAFKRFIANHSLAPALAGIGKTQLMYHTGSLTDVLANLTALGAALSDQARLIRQTGAVPTAEALFASHCNQTDRQACQLAAARIEKSSYAT
ncbi:MAG: hypothetical protein CVV27_12235 [Candidatus Melainabacteria bacterium HGW-Melainabacteria-1]|nr:MAG: hypothetical protein CVV27_12235 [Candidatus Melainabacteria bacterium HGW-Melainabacteria-1]